MNDALIMAIGLAILSIASGMLGLGVAFAAVPFLGIFLHDLVHEVQPLSLVLNGVTALFSLLGFARSGLVDWRQAILLAIVTTAVAPLGAWLAQHIDARWLWAFYFLAVAFLAWRMFLPDKAEEAGAAAAAGKPNHSLALTLAVPISVVAGMLGVGPGFLLLPTLILLRYEPKHAAAINALAVTPPSFSALIPHLATARIDLTLAAVLVAVGAIGSFVGARVTSLYVPGKRLKQGFGVLIVVMTAYKLFQILNK
ncbi:sulfite exporter TauE/SafE family protein [Sulfuricystis multivorans]|uniref:sulfite exporter TauE/SafE family protein n=1 Tax=Sulfuricystis multivorans TaxID=2211108 RepID=UPI000F83DA50|nr:sulfite exporter TauE/SafE family protein [Sulfuricystis multivorans]